VHWLQRSLSYVVEPISYLASIPTKAYRWGDSQFKSHRELLEENQSLTENMLEMSQQVQRLEALTQENERLRGLMLSSKKLDGQVLIAEIIGLDNDPFRHEVVLDRGSFDAVEQGFAVLDQSGLMGQIIHVGPYTSRALLITDKAHATPVQVNRNGVRAIAVGAGALDKLELVHVPDTADLKVGDLLVSSGLGGRFPSGYPVGYITYIENDPGQAFASVQARPASHLDRRMHVMILSNVDQKGSDHTESTKAVKEAPEFLRALEPAD